MAGDDSSNERDGKADRRVRALAADGVFMDLLRFGGEAMLWILLPLLPKPPRERLSRRFSIPLANAAVVSGLVEVFLSLFVYYYAYQATVYRWTQQMDERIAERVENGTQPKNNIDKSPRTIGIFGGTILYVSFLFSPQGIGVIIMFGEGVIRAAVVGVTSEVTGSFFLATPYYLVRAAWWRGSEKLSSLMALPPRPDGLRRLHGHRGDGYLLDTDRLQEGFAVGVAVMLRDSHYRLHRIVRRRRRGRAGYRLLLRPWPGGEAIRKRVRYEPPA